MIKRQPLRYILADDPGAGKTIMTGLFIKELMVRADLRRCLIVAPGGLVHQWQEELWQKFHVRFELLSSDRLTPSLTSNFLAETDKVIARLDTLARNEELQKQLKATDWDLIVCDEAHKMSATIFGWEIKRTKRFDLGKLLSRLSRHFLLLTATPHNGKENDFQLFLSLIDEDRFECSPKKSYEARNVSDVMRRLVKEELLRFDGTPLFPERLAYTVNYALAKNESELYDKVTEYVRVEFNRANKLNNEQKTSVGFALTILQRRLASSPEAIYQSLKRRRERLTNRLEEVKNGRAKLETSAETAEYYASTLEDGDDWPSGEFEELEQNIVDRATAAKTVKELEAEILILKGLVELASQVRASGEDRKWQELAGLLSDNFLMVGPNGQRQKLIIFTEHRDTLNYLTTKIRLLLNKEKAVVNIHGGLGREERRKVEALFKQDKEAFILIATDAAGEGINLQRAHLMVNYDLPWNPNRLEQRFGRIHRIGQLEVCHLWNLVASETREGLVFQLLFDKLEKAREALGGKVFDVLGRLTFDEKSLKDLLIEAVCYNNDQEVRDKMSKVVSEATDQKSLEELIKSKVLTEDYMNLAVCQNVKEKMERLEARKTQPHYIETFFLAAYRSLGGQIRPRENGRYEIKTVPSVVQSRSILNGGPPVLSRYERICFEKRLQTRPDQIPAELVYPGHPLLDSVVDVVRERGHDVLKRGTILIDDSDYSEAARLLFYLESAIQDATVTKDGRQRVIARDLQYVELDESKTAKSAGIAPYLNYRAANEAEIAAIKEYPPKASWLLGDLEAMAMEYALNELTPKHLKAVKERKEELVEKTIAQVKERLISEIRYWDFQAAELADQEAEGKNGSKKMTAQRARKRANDLEIRLKDRLKELEREKSISALPPVLVGGALVVPIGLVHQLMGTPETEEPDFGGLDRKAAELAAMAEVMRVERSLGFIPKDVSAEKLGYDIESVRPVESRGSGSILRFIEVKGRVKGSTTVTVTKTEHLTALNKQEDYILALVELDGERKTTWYVKNPFINKLDFGIPSINLDISNYKAMAFETFSS
jgi:superfamily II DNA or RNA helicase